MTKMSQLLPISLDGGIIVITIGSKSLITGKKFQIFNSVSKPDKTSVQAARPG